MRKLTEQKGFTVAELLIVVAIVAVLVAIALPTFTAQLASAKEAVDTANCRSAQAAATTVCLTDCHGDFSKKTLEEWVEIALADGIPKHGQADPTSTLNCQIESNNHLIKFFYGEAPGTSDPTNPGTNPTPDDPSTPDVPDVPDVPTNPDVPDTPDVPDNPNNNPTNTYPGTDIPLSTGVWPSQSEWDDNEWKTYNVEPSGIFLYEGTYYVVTTRIPLSKQEAPRGPGGAGQNSAIKITGNIIRDWTNPDETRSGIKDGDICVIGNSYYVYKEHGGDRVPNPIKGPYNWYKLP